MTNIHSFEILISETDKIIGDIRYPSSEIERLPIVVITHGFTGHKDWGFIPYFSEQLSKNGFITISYNFTTDSIDPESDLFIDIDKFATFSISQEVSELKVLVNYILTKSIFPPNLKNKVDTSRISLVGQSLGGAVTIIYAATYDQIDKIVLLGSIGTLFRYSKRQIEAWKKNQIWNFTNTRTNQDLKLNFSYYLDLVENNYHLDKYLNQIQIPTLFIHGSEDLTVSLQEIKNLINKAKNPFVELSIIEKTGHTFGVEHPFSAPTEALKIVISTTLNFLKP